MRQIQETLNSDILKYEKLSKKYKKHANNVYISSITIGTSGTIFAFSGLGGLISNIDTILPIPIISISLEGFSILCGLSSVSLNIINKKLLKKALIYTLMYNNVIDYNLRIVKAINKCVNDKNICVREMDFIIQQYEEYLKTKNEIKKNNQIQFDQNEIKDQLQNIDTTKLKGYPTFAPTTIAPII